LQPNVEEEEEASIIILCLFKVLGQCSILATWSSCLADPGMATPISSIPKFSFSLPPSNPTAGSIHKHHHHHIPHTKF
jgi:hypothetical protein